MDSNWSKSSANPPDLDAVRESSASFALLKTPTGPKGRRTGLIPYTARTISPHLCPETLATKDFEPRLKGDHPYQTTTKYQRNADGSFARDPEGYLVPIIPPKDEKRERRESTPAEREEGRQRIAAKAKEEERAMTKLNRQVVGRTATGELVRRGKRQSIGDPNCRPSENEDFPLLAVLRRDQRHDLILAALNYRQLVALCESEPLKGMDYSAADGLEVVRRHVLRDGVKEVEAAAKDGFRGHQVAGGEIVYRSEVKRSKGPYSLPVKHKRPAVAKDDGDPIIGRTRSLHVTINDNNLAEYIDAQPRLAKIRAALGGLQDPLEDAVLGGRTMQQIGEEEGFKGASAASAGKALVYRGLAILDGFFGTQKYRVANDNYMIEKRKIA